MKTCITLVAAGLCVLAFPLFSQEVDEGDVAPLSLKGKHALEVHVGLLGSTRAATEVSIGTVTTSGTSNGFLGAVAYSFWVNDELAVTVSAGVSDASAKTSTSIGGVYVETGAIVPVLFGIKYQPFHMTDDNMLRPYLLAAAGPTFGHASNVYTGTSVTTEAVSETVLGSRLGLGLDLSVSRRIFLGAGIGYRFISEFENRIGSRTDYSGADFLVTFGVLLGGH